MHIFTIGYEGATQAELIAVLKAANVALLADVRAVPLSRQPGFSKNILAGGLREAARRGNHARLAEVYAGQLELPEAIVQGARLQEMARERPTALLCFERNAHGCHRSLLIGAIMPEATVTNLFV